ncbi:ABC transporter permease [Nitratireductor aquimarinus]|uniref:ABC transporter permease n=1 Tax=Nitratireductor aquimarinus TaxID=889300 RepID=UPI00398E5EE4
MSRRILLIRALRLCLTVLVAAIVIFLMVRLSGDPIEILAGPDATPERVEQMRAKWGLDAPLQAQFWSYLTNAVRGDFGYSIKIGMPAAELFLARLPATLLLGATSFGVSLLVGLPLGILAALRHNSAIDRLVMTLAVFAFSMPNFFLGVLFILLFSLQLHWLPSFGSGSALHLIMPALTLGLSGSGAMARFARSSMLDVLNQPYVMSARARGVPMLRRTVLHALPNALIPLVTIIGMRLGDLIAGAIVVETVFAWPGVGRLLADSVSSRDLAVVQVIVLATCVTMVTANFLVDILYGWLDPRVKQS